MIIIHISPAAADDFKDIRKYIETELENPAAAFNIISKITKAIHVLATFPDIGKPLSLITNIQTDYRYLVTGSYHVFYRYNQDDVYIVRILYSRRDYMRILFGEPKDL